MGESPNHKGPDERKAEGDVTTEENIKRWGGGTRGCSEDGGRSPDEEHSWPLATAKGKGRTLCSEPPKEIALQMP